MSETRSSAVTGPDHDLRIAQTLDRGIQVLELMAARSGPMSVSEIARELGVGRTIAQRLVTTLRHRRLVTGPPGGPWRLGLGLVELSSQVEPDLNQASDDVLERLAQDTRATAHLSIRDGDDIVALLAHEPPNRLLAITWRTGARHPIELGAAGIAIRTLRPQSPDEPPAVTECRVRGWAASHGSLDDGAVAIAAPIGLSRWDIEVAVGIVTTGTIDEPAVADAVLAAAQQIRQRLSA